MRWPKRRRIKDQEVNGGYQRGEAAAKSILLLSLSKRRYCHRENWLSVLWALSQACKHPGPQIWGSPGRPRVDKASCPPLRKLQAELQLMDDFMNSEITLMFQVPRNLFHHSKHDPTTTQIIRMGKEKWWFSRRGFVKEYSFYCQKKKKKSAFWREDGQWPAHWYPVLALEVRPKPMLTACEENPTALCQQLTGAGI